MSYARSKSGRMALQIVFTGRAVDARGVFHHRNALFTACDEIGWTVRSQVDSSTSVLVASEEVGDTKKVRDARRMGVQVRDYAWFFAHLNAERQARTDHARAQQRGLGHAFHTIPGAGATMEVRGSDGVLFSATGDLRIEVAPERNRSSFDRNVSPEWIALMIVKQRWGDALRSTLERVEELSAQLGMCVEGRLTGGADTAPLRLRAYSGPCPTRDEAHLFAMYDLVPGRMRAEMAGLLASRRDAEHVPEPVPYVRKTVRRGIS